MSEMAAKFMREGNALLAAGSSGPACIAFCHALDLEPRLAAAHYNLGAVLLMAGRAADSLPSLMSAVMLLNYLAEVDGKQGYREVAVRIRDAYDAALLNGEKTGDIGGTLGTRAFADAIVRRVEAGN